MNDNYSPDYLRQGATLGMVLGGIRAARTVNKQRRKMKNRVLTLLRRMGKI